MNQPRSSLLASPASAAGSDRATAATGPCVPNNATCCLCSLSSFNLDMETIRTKPVIGYTQKTWKLSSGEPMHAESGYWRPKPDGTIEVVIAQSTDLVEV
ncbi:hypothetical protein RIF29_34484 [Crotalaria pallida]|uniref:THAP4-like heme-binding domain-containing protein n=1 Tax=Crotalaria pallida TaxID=3830 RepID=A0AAN9HXE9_CROPI